MPDKVSGFQRKSTLSLLAVIPGAQPALRPLEPQALSQALVVHKDSMQRAFKVASSLPAWMDHEAFRCLPPGPKRYLWDRKTRQDQYARRAPLYNDLRFPLNYLPSRAWFIRSTDESPHERREAFEPRGLDGIRSSWTQGDAARKVEKIATEKRVDAASLTILRDFVDRILGPVSDHAMAKKKLRSVLPRVHPDNLSRLLRPDDKLSQPGLEEASAKSRALFQGLSLLPTAEERASGRYIDRRKQWIQAKVFEGSLSGADKRIGRLLRETYALYETVQGILKEPIYQELLFRVPQATDDAKLSLQNVRLLMCFFWAMLLERLREALAGAASWWSAWT